MTGVASIFNAELARPSRAQAALARLTALRQAHLADQKQFERVRYAIVDPATGGVLRWGHTQRRDLGIKPKDDHHLLIELDDDHPYPRDMVFDPVAKKLRAASAQATPTSEAS